MPRLERVKTSLETRSLFGGFSQLKLTPPNTKPSTPKRIGGKKQPKVAQKSNRHHNLNFERKVTMPEQKKKKTGWWESILTGFEEGSLFGGLSKMKPPPMNTKPSSPKGSGAKANLKPPKK